MNTEEALRQQLLSNDALVAIVKDGVFPGLIPSADSFPAITYQRTATEKDLQLDGDGLRTVRFQISCLGTTWDEAKQMSLLVAEAFPAELTVLGDDFQIDSVLIDGVTDVGRDEELPMFRFDLDIEIRDTNSIEI